MKGWGDLFLLCAVCVAGWTRTPVGSIAHNLVASVRGHEKVALLAHFNHNTSSFSDSLEKALMLPSQTPEGWNPGLKQAILAHMGQDSFDQIMLLHEDPQIALEMYAIGGDLREKAIRRAKVAGLRNPESYESYRRYLSQEAAESGDKTITEVLALSTVLQLSWPVDSKVRISSPFGWRVHPVLKTKRFHHGVDLPVPEGTPVWAAGAGKIIKSSKDDVNGNYLVISHGHGVTTSYCHASDLQVAIGDKVKKGEKIMLSGNTGRSTGPHLHFGLRINGRSIDPAIFRPPQE